MKPVFAGLAFLAAACASVQHDPSYDDAGAVEIAPSDSISITIVNHRTVDAIAPTVYLVGTGRRFLGSVEGMGGKLERRVDLSWVGVDGCMQIIAHYAGGPDLVFDKLCWQPGENVEATLDNIFNPIAAWSHR